MLSEPETMLVRHTDALGGAPIACALHEECVYANLRVKRPGEFCFDFQHSEA